MRQIITGRSEAEVQRKLESIDKIWKPISEIKKDDSGIGYSYIRYVCVVEAEDKPHRSSSWGQFII